MQGRHVRLEFRQRSVVGDDVIGPVKTRRPVDLRGQNGINLLAGQSIARGKPLVLDGFRGIDDKDAVDQLLLPGFEQ